MVSDTTQEMVREMVREMAQELDGTGLRERHGKFDRIETAPSHALRLACFDSAGADKITDRKGNWGERPPGISWRRLLPVASGVRRRTVGLRTASVAGVSSTVVCLSRHTIIGGCARPCPVFS
jgi:hypothetical protein